MNRFIIILIFSLTNTIIYSQTLNGIITRMNSGKTGIDGVQIASLGANPAISNAGGHFRLVYQYKNSGAGVSLQVEKAGFEVVNKDALFTYLGNQYDTLKIYMCRKGELDSLRIQYYNISLANIQKRYHEEINKLKAQNAATQQNIARLDQDLKAAITQAGELARRFSIINLDDCSELFRNAFTLFQQGKITEAIEALPDSVIDAQIEAANFQIREAQLVDSIASEKKGKALQVIKMIQDGKILAAAVMDSLQQQSVYLLKAGNTGLPALVQHADILFCLKDWENAALLYEKAVKLDPAKKRIYLQRRQHCLTALAKQLPPQRPQGL